MIDDKDEMIQKIDRLLGWFEKKLDLELFGRRSVPHEGYIYWAGVGENLGAEIYGKGKDFARPVLIYKKLGTYHFMGIPLTSKEHVVSWYVHFKHEVRDEYAVLSQAKVMSIKRLYRRIGRVDDADFARIRAGFLNLYK